MSMGTLGKEFETITAVATASGQAGIGVIRVSGPLAPQIAQTVVGQCPPPRKAYYGLFRDEDGEIIDEGLVLYFPAPHSFTGEDVVEFQGHGGQIILECLLQRIIRCGARLARPGEFSERAFLNDKLDLAQAEAIADLIAANSEQAARSAMRSLQGEFSEAVQILVEQLIALRMFVEAAIDFPEEEIDFLSDTRITQQLSTIKEQLSALTHKAQQGVILRDGIKLALAGSPNVGKSSLLNRLTGEDTAIVTPVPGTTRDLLRAEISIEGVRFQLVDTAGLRESQDIVEQEGIRRAENEIKQADLMLLVIDHSQPSDFDDSFSAVIEKFSARKRLIIVRNKIDVTFEEPAISEQDDAVSVMVSAKTGAGMDFLQKTILATVGYQSTHEGTFSARRRHLLALESATEHLKIGAAHLSEDRAGELLAEELRLAQNSLNEITGDFRADDLLGKIFTTFCIGK
jgi:tRNA modification GTPase